MNEHSYFTVDEMRCHSGVDYPEEWVESRLRYLFADLNVIREAWGSPLVIVSGYRTAKYNARLAEASTGVAQNSQHVQGRAADVRPLRPTRASVAALAELVLNLHAQGKLPNMGGFEHYPGLWVHVDCRAHAPGQLARWKANGIGSST